MNLATTLEAPPPVDFIVWEDLLVFAINGTVKLSHYQAFGLHADALHTKYPAGIGCLTIISKNAPPPSDEVQRAGKEAVASVERRLRCLCWLVEGGGFQGAMARAVLTGLRMFARYPFPTHVTSNLTEAIAWSLPHLATGGRRGGSVLACVEHIQRRRGRVG